MTSDSRVTIDLNPRQQRLYDQLRAQVVKRRAGAGSGVGDLLLLLPDLAVLLLRLMRDPRVPPGSKLIAVLAAGYVLSPIDLMPEVLLGPLGLVDDLLVLGAALSRMLNHVHPDVVRSHWSGQGDALEAIQRVSSWTESQLVGRVRRLANRMVRRLRR